MAQLQFLAQKSYQSVPVQGSSLIYAVDPDRPVGYSSLPVSGLSPTLQSNKRWRATQRDMAVSVEAQVAQDLGSFPQLADAFATCQFDADENGVGILTFQESTSYQSQPIRNWPWVYNISQPSGDPNGATYWRSLRRDASLTDDFQTAIPIGNYNTLVDAISACQNDFDSNAIPSPVPPPVYPS